MTDNCSNCKSTIPLDADRCTKCGADVAPPNVRFAARATEAKALSSLVAIAQEAAAANGVSAEIVRLENLAKNSQMVINRKLRALSDWINSEDELYLNFYKLKEKGIAYKYDIYNRQRISAENTISPIFFDRLIIGALTVDGQGMSYYGKYTVVIRSTDIERRASVFWENPFIFNKKHNIISGEDPPEGYRAPWQEREKVVIAKLADAIKPGDNDHALSILVMGPDRNTADCNFVEVHVYNQIHVNEIERVIPPHAIPEDEENAWEFLREKLAGKGISC